MKKLSILFVAAMALLAQGATAQVSMDNNLFNHLSVGVSTGTEGLFGIDVAAPIGNYVQVRAGYSVMPRFKFTADIDYSRKKNGVENNYTTEAAIKLKKGDFKILFDAYPFKGSSFHVTAGAYMGSSTFADIYNNEPLEGVDESEWGTGLIQISDNPEHMFSTDDKGNVKGRVKVGGFKPYLGIGFGRMIPKKLVSVNFDLGVQFWGSPKVQIWQHDVSGLDSKWVTLKKSDYHDDVDASGNVVKKATDKDGYKLVNTLGKVSVYPVMQLRVGFRAF